MSQRLTVVVDDDVPELLLDLAGSSRKQGETVSELIRVAHATRGSTEAQALEQLSLEGVRLMVLGLAGRITALEGRLLQLESKQAEARP